MEEFRGVGKQRAFANGESGVREAFRYCEFNFENGRQIIKQSWICMFSSAPMLSKSRDTQIS
jgi:hypothetical protein